MRSTPTPKKIAAATAVLALTMAACSGDSDSDDDSTADAPASAESPRAEPDTDDAADAGSEGSSTSVGIAGSRFDPLETTVAVGDTVSFTNTDPFAHTVTANDGQAVSFDSGEFGQDETFEVTFDEAGSFAYFCEIHPTMRATVVVN
ncbi:cupredoxin domain-containing protein [Ilumatobacter coccineus]|nr:plastocyanin/azurin family copper-binding protein [Ilumatobacter coccineus]